MLTTAGEDEEKLDPLYTGNVGNGKWQSAMENIWGIFKKLKIGLP